MFTIKAVDLFCGAGGASTGLVRACQAHGLNIKLLAVNHWPTAVKTHELNHPGVVHLCEAVERVNPNTPEFVDPTTGRTFRHNGRLQLLLAGPECTHHSTARGGRPINDQSRATAWHILKWAQEVYIDTILIENVPEFRSWGPLGANGKPLKSKKGQTYRAFLDALRSLGYDHIEERLVNCADYGDPTTRQRLFVMAHRGHRQLLFPHPTHSRTGGRSLLRKTKKWRAAREIIDWQLKGRSIFKRKKPLAPATMARILAGLEKFGGPDLQPFLVVLRNHAAGRSIERPLPTLSAQGQHVGLAQPFIVDAAHGNDAKSAKPASRTKSVRDPLGTITGSNRYAIAQPFIVANNHNNQPRSLDEPVATVTGGNRHYLAQPFMVPVNHGADSGHRPRSVDEPLPTLTAKANQYLVEPFILGQQTGSVPRSTDEPLPTIATDGAISLAQPFLVPLYGERPTQDPRTHSVDEPVPTIPATGGGKFGVVEPFITKFNGTAKTRAYSVDDPLDTVATKDRFGLAEPYIVQTSERRRHSVESVDQPLKTITAQGGRCFGLAQPQVTTVDGRTFVLDIHFRMLQPHELAAAMSFPKAYTFTGTREDIVKQIGNAWPGETALALCSAIVKPYAARGRTVNRKERTA